MTIERLRSIQTGEIAEVIRNNGGALIAYLKALPIICGTTPWGHDLTCYAHATKIARRYAPMAVGDNYITLYMQHWYYCDTHIPTKKKLVEMRARIGVV